MSYDLYIGDRTFSSWSLRGWLMGDAFKLPMRVHLVGLYSGTMQEDLAALAPARFVPTLRLPDGTVVGETMAIAETLAERHADAGLWPAEAAARATARWLCSEMATGFTALRSECPMQLLHVWKGFAPSDGVRADLERIETLWDHAKQFSADGPWLFGAYSLADVFFAPVCARIIGYDLPVSKAARAYALMSLAHPSVQSWRRQGLEVVYDPAPYTLNLDKSPWPVPH